MATWRRRSSQPQTVFMTAFDRRVADIYGSIAGYAKGKKSDAGRVTRSAQIMPFTQMELAGWLLLQLGNDRAGAVQCAYCREWMNIETLTIDHKIPKATPWNGSLAFENMCCCCSTCNSRKSRMSEYGFRKLIEFSLTIDPRDAKDMMGRLANGAGYRPLQGRYIALLGKQNGGKKKQNPQKRMF